eukprot:470059-Prorocentrum_minimum.AAC.2
MSCSSSSLASATSPRAFSVGNCCAKYALDPAPPSRGGATPVTTCASQNSRHASTMCRSKAASLGAKEVKRGSRGGRSRGGQEGVKRGSRGGCPPWGHKIEQDPPTSQGINQKIVSTYEPKECALITLVCRVFLPLRGLGAQAGFRVFWRAPGEGIAAEVVGLDEEDGHVPPLQAGDRHVPGALCPVVQGDVLVPEGASAGGGQEGIKRGSRGGQEGVKRGSRG